MAAAQKPRRLGGKRDLLLEAKRLVQMSKGNKNLHLVETDISA